jgi:hypothetical protein
MKIRLLIVLLLLSIPTAILRAEDPFGDDYLIDKDFKPGKQWKEGKIRLPAIPRDGNLIPVDIPHSRFKYYIDSKSISVGKDRVGRYTVVIISPSGVRNIFYEGIRCGVEQVRTYAYAIGKGSFNIMAGSKWQQIKRSGANLHQYRDHLLSFYFCAHDRLRDKVQDIVHRLRYPPSLSAPESEDY